ncbi:RHS repeat domain-containing protein [Nafulsella turpanensis]|uniref:RHS repeat domain-containing protein n=1 Tax=Nafulsella turpanensis TaxID=1265690 RepID=UPI00135F11F9|nr:hypothetical protein [Nafulsella turpanensis]
MEDKIINWKIGSKGELNRSQLAAEWRLNVMEVRDNLKYGLHYFFDSAENIVCSKVMVNEENNYEEHVTYNIFDSLGRIRYILQPQFVEELANGSPLVECIAKYAFQYQYWLDTERIKAQKIPGGAWKYMIYDIDGKLRMYKEEGDKRWKVNKFDRQGRHILFGSYDSNLEQEELQNLVFSSDNDFEVVDYTTRICYSLDRSFPQLRELDLFSITYYDNYHFLKNDSLFQFHTIEGHNEKPSDANGMVTGEVVKSSMDSLPMMTTFYYDNSDRIIQIVYHNPFGGIDRFAKSYFSDDPGLSDLQLKSTLVHQGLEKVKIQKSYTYTSSSTEITHQINEQAPVSLVKYWYNDSGLIQRKIWNGSIKNDYVYDDDLNLTEIIATELKDGSLGKKLGIIKMNLNYGKKNLLNLFQNSQNVSSLEVSYFRPQRPAYQYQNVYSYDSFNRLKSAKLQVGIQNSWESYSIRNLFYDKNGNILSLTRARNKKVIDRLNYEYCGNRLLRISDFGNRKKGFKEKSRKKEEEYFYDSKGNTILDLNSNITSPIQYNFLSLPVEMINGEYISQVSYLRNNKIKVIVQGKDILQENVFVNSEYTEDEIQYQNNSIKIIEHSEGRIVKNGDQYEYEFFLKDHLNRVIVIFDAVGEVENLNNFFPFGLKIPLLEYTGRGITNYYPHHFQIYNFRIYNPIIGRFLNCNPLSELELDYSPYHYGYNNPSSNFVPLGLTVQSK